MITPPHTLPSFDFAVWGHGGPSCVSAEALFHAVLVPALCLRRQLVFPVRAQMAARTG